MDFLRVPLTATAGWLIYSEPLDLFTVLGAVLILAGNSLNLRGGRSGSRAGGNLSSAFDRLAVIWITRNQRCGRVPSLGDRMFSRLSEFRNIYCTKCGFFV